MSTILQIYQTGETINVTIPQLTLTESIVTEIIHHLQGTRSDIK